MSGVNLQGVIQATGWTLVHFVWEGLAIASLLAIALRALRNASPQTRYLAGCFAMLLMAIAPVITFPVVMKQNASGPPTVATATSPIASTQTLTRVRSEAPTQQEREIQTVTANVAPRNDFSQRFETMLPWVVGIWLAGVLGLSCRLCVGWWQVNRLRRQSSQSPGADWEAKLAELARRLGVTRALRLVESAWVEVPTVIGWVRPVILLPASCLTGLNASQLEAILAHELAHIHRHDYLVNLLQSALETLLFYHPAVWWASQRVREERENCCDDMAVGVCGDRVAYARALATLEELRPASAQLALAAGGGVLLRRVRRLLAQNERGAARPAWPVAGIVLMLVAVIFAAGMRQQHAQAHEMKAPPIATQTPTVVQTTNKEPVRITNSSAARTNGQPGVFNWTGDGVQGRLAQQWFWYRVGENPPQATRAAASATSGMPTATGAVTTNSVPASAAPNSITNDGPYQLASNAYNRASLVYTGKGRQEIIAKLDHIRVDSVRYPDLPLKEVIADLSKLARERDPDMKGINFFLSAELDSATGQPKSSLDDVHVNVNLENVRLADILDAITRTADRPIHYSILDYAVMFHARDANALETRTFHVDPNTFMQGLQNVVGVPFGAGANGAVTTVPRVNVTGGSGTNGGVRFVTTTNDTSALLELVKRFFASSGIDFGTNSGKAIFYSDGKGLLTFRGTAQDMDLAEAAIQGLNVTKTESTPQGKDWHLGVHTNWIGYEEPSSNTTPSINIKASFVELVGQPAILGNLGARVLTSTPSNTNSPSGIFPGANVPGSNITAAAQPSGVFMSTLEDFQLKRVLGAIEMRDGTRILNGLEAKTEIGRPLTFLATGEKPSTNTAQTMLPFGPVLQVTPSLEQNGESLRLDVTVGVYEFAGYDETNEVFVPEAALPSGQKITSTLPLPNFKMVKTARTATLKPGETLVIGGLTTDGFSFVSDSKATNSESTKATSEQSPTIGDKPLPGRFFRSQSYQKSKKTLLIFVTPTVSK